MDNAAGFRILFRVQIGKALYTQETSLDTYFDGRRITIQSDETNQPLSQAEWIVLSARGFSTETEAQHFGEKLRTAMEIAALCTCLGIDTGEDKDLSSFNQDLLRSRGTLGPDESLAPHRHGLAVLPDKRHLLLKMGPASLLNLLQPADLTDSITELGNQSLTIRPAIAAPLRLLNLALINSDRRAQILLAFSAVEAAAQTRPWTEKQHEYIAQMTDDIKREFPGSEEHAEIAKAIRLLHHGSLRQSVIRLLRENDLAHLKKEWDDIYGRRSAVVHGKTQLSKPELNSLANDAIQLCGTIILGLVRQNSIQLPPIADTRFESLRESYGARNMS